MPLSLHSARVRDRQLGVVHFATGEYEEARDRFGKVLSIVEGLSAQVNRRGVKCFFPFYLGVF